MGRQKREKQAHRGGLIVGRISLTRRGYGFVDAPEGDIYVSAHDTAGAMHGDTVAVRPQARRGKEGRRGSVVRIIERKTATIVGR
jgi:ribonuclease R